MSFCDRCKDLIWEDLYGLLEPEESHELHSHVAGCPVCRREQERAEAGSNLVAQIARLDVTIPLFKIPEVSPTRLAAEPRQVQELNKRRPRAWPWLAAAAALLALIGVYGGYVYRTGLSQRLADYAAVERLAERFVAERNESLERARNEVGSIVAVSLTKCLRVRVVGPAFIYAGDTLNYRVVATDLSGKPVKVQARARLLYADARLAWQSSQVSGSGELNLTFTKTGERWNAGAGRLLVEVTGLGETVRLEGQVALQDTAFATHLDLDRSEYRPNERVLFRSVTLDSFGLKPPTEKVPVRYKVQGPSGFELPAIEGLILEGGIGGGEILLPANAPPGEYTLTMTARDNRFAALARKFLVARSGSKPDQLMAGDARIAQGKKTTVEFFPEGGTICAESGSRPLQTVPNRIYFRVHSHDGRPVQGHGVVVDDLGREVARAVVSKDDSGTGIADGLGVFTLPASAKRTYRFRLSIPGGEDVVCDLPPGRQDTIALSTPAGVVDAGRPVGVVLTVPGHPKGAEVSGAKPVFVVALSARGRLVAHQVVRLGGGTTQINLDPGTGVQGILRVTAMAWEAQGLVPLAERLVYRRPRGRLDACLIADRSTYTPGSRVKLVVRDERSGRENTPAWFSLSVTKAGPSQSGPRSTSLPAAFQWLTEPTDPGQVDVGHLLVRSDTEAARSLDLYLGTSGWRTFRQDYDRYGLARHGTADFQGAHADETLLLSLDNFREADEHQLRLVRAEFDDQQKALQSVILASQENGRARLAELHDRALAVHAFRTEAAEVVRLSIGTVAGAVFIAGATALLVGVFSLLRKRVGTRKWLAGAMACLSACLLVVVTQPYRYFEPAKFAEPDGIAKLARNLENQELLALEQNERSGYEASFATVMNLKTVPTQSPRLTLAEAAPGDSTRAQPLLAAMTVGKPGDFAAAGIGRAMAIRTSDPGGITGSAAQAAALRPLALRHYAYQAPSRSSNRPEREVHTVFWHPLLILADGRAQVEFDLPRTPSIYKVRLEGHSSDGSVTLSEHRLESR